MATRGNTREINRLFHLLPTIEAYIEDSIGFQLMRASLLGSQELLCDEFVKIHTDIWKTDKNTQTPSVLQQLYTTAQAYNNILSLNYYFPLQDDYEYEIDSTDPPTTMTLPSANQISSSDKTMTNQFDVDVIDLDSIDVLISEQQQRDSTLQVQDSNDLISQTQNAANATIYIYRIDVKRLFRTPEKTSDIFKRFFLAFKKVDPHAAIRPVYANDANKIPVINTPLQVKNPEQMDLSKYHKPWTPNQRFGLSGQLLIETSLEFTDLCQQLHPWLHTTYYEISLAECQTSELVTIGVLIRVSYTLYRNELIANTKAIIAGLPAEAQFEFSIRADNWFCSVGKVNVLFVAVSRDKLKQGMDYFCNMYDGVNQKVAMGAKMVFVPLYQIQLTQEMREQIGQEQRSWQDNEIAIFVQGFKDLSTTLTLRNGSKCSLRSLLLRLPNNPQSIRKALFHGIDRRAESNEWIAMKYHRDDEAILKRRTPGIAYEIAQMVVEDDISKIFVDPTVGLNFGGEWRHSFSANTKTGRRTNPTPTDPALLTHFQTILGRLQPPVVKRPAITPEMPRQTYSTPPPMQSSYASRASSATYTTTSTTVNSSPDASITGNRQTRTESVLVIEQYEARFVHVESRLTLVERSVNRSGNMLAKLLQHNGIELDDEDETPLTNSPMEIENQNQTTGGTKRNCPTTEQRELSQRVSSTNNHA